jgi:glycosyltransferase involved in cell wall biosynthesis
MKILVMPSWYPNKNHNAGSFFKEQADFLNVNEFDIKVLMAEELRTKNYFYQLLKRIIKRESNKLTTTYLEQGPEAYSFPVIIEKGWSEEKQMKVANKKHLIAFKSLISSGWMPDIIHVQGSYNAGFSARYISDRYNIPYVVIEHSPFEISAYSKFRQEQIKKVLQDANAVAGVSHYQRKRMQDDGIDREVDVIWNFMDENEFKPIKAQVNSKFVITTITRPVKVKDVDTFFKAVSQFITKIEDRSTVEVVIVGHAAINDLNTNTDYYDKKAAELGISDVCTCIAFLSREEIKILLDRTQVFISTSLDEPYGIAIREAMLCGVPVIVTKSGGPEDSITDKTGVLVEKRDVEAISQNILNIYNGSLAFDSEYIRNYVVAQSGSAAFLKTMTKFYSIIND